MFTRRQLSETLQDLQRLHPNSPTVIFVRYNMDRIFETQAILGPILKPNMIKSGKPRTSFFCRHAIEANPDVSSRNVCTCAASRFATMGVGIRGYLVLRHNCLFNDTICSIHASFDQRCVLHMSDPCRNEVRLSRFSVLPPIRYHTRKQHARQNEDNLEGHDSIGFYSIFTRRETTAGCHVLHLLAVQRKADLQLEDQVFRTQH